jgi:ribosomal protein S18 acetylase RimI-like enzyme
MSLSALVAIKRRNKLNCFERNQDMVTIIMRVSGGHQRLLLFVFTIVLGLAAQGAAGWTTTPKSTFSSTTIRPTTQLFHTSNVSHHPQSRKDGEASLILEQEFRIRDCQYAELGECASIILSSFYSNTTKSPWRQLYRMGELNRIQQGFPYGDDRAHHRMLVAIILRPDDNATSSVHQLEEEEMEKERIVGFVDVDTRIPNRDTTYTYNPRPYLSDLCIHPDFRRRGIAKELVRACEQFVVRSRMTTASSAIVEREQQQKKELYIRVEANNKAAIDMYSSMGYEAIHNPDDPGKDAKILILHRLLLMREEACNEKELSMLNATSRL